MVKLKPVFDDKKDKERYTERDQDITTVSKVERDIVEDIVKKETPIPNMVTKEEAEGMARRYANEASEQAVNTALERYDSRRREEEDSRRREEEDRRIKEIEVERSERRKRKDEEDGDTGQAISTKTVNELKNIASVFNALKEFSANPLQKKIEESVGGFAAGVVERAFSPPHQEQKKDFVDQILNSNFASGLGAGLGQRGPELVDVFTKNFGKEKVDGWITGAIKGGGVGSGVGGTGMMGGIGSVIGGGMGGVGAPPPGVGSEKQQSEVELILGLDPNSPEHIAAYAHSQGDISVGTARKILMMHQDDFIKQLELRGVDTTPYKLGRGQNQNQNQNQNISNQNISNQNQDLTSMSSMPESGNVQEYRRSPSRVNEDLMVNTPATEDKKWESETDKTDAYVNNLETQNVELHPEMERMEPGNEVNKVESNLGNTEIMTYLKNIGEQLKLSNDSIIGLKDIVKKQNSDMSNLRQELDIIKRDRTIPDDILNDRDNKEDNQTTVRSKRTIKKGFSYVKDNSIKDDVEG
jgi:hypothetical protein